MKNTLNYKNKQNYQQKKVNMSFKTAHSKRRINKVDLSEVIIIYFLLSNFC